MKVVLAPDSFKGSLDAAAAAHALAAGWLAVRPQDTVVELPMADGGEGTVTALAGAVPGARLLEATVTGPVRGERVSAPWALLPDGTAVVEIAATSGLPLAEPRDPLGATTRGLGELLGHALDAGASRVLIALGGSATTDGATGALTALGARLLDAAGAPVRPGGGGLADLASVDLSRLRPPPSGGVRCLTDVTAPLLGPDGAAAVFAPQKGADAEQVRLLEAALGRLADVLGGDPRTPGSGAAGGAGYGLATAWGAELVPGAAHVAARIGLDAELHGADLVITGEGALDRTSTTGKVVSCVLALAAARGVPVVLVCGQVGTDVPAGVRAAMALADLAGSVEAAIAAPQRWLAEAAGSLAATARADAPSRD